MLYSKALCEYYKLDTSEICKIDCVGCILNTICAYAQMCRLLHVL